MSVSDDLVNVPSVEDTMMKYSADKTDVLRHETKLRIKPFWEDVREALRLDELSIHEGVFDESFFFLHSESNADFTELVWWLPLLEKDESFASSLCKSFLLFLSDFCKRSFANRFCWPFERCFPERLTPSRFFDNLITLSGFLQLLNRFSRLFLLFNRLQWKFIESLLPVFVRHGRHLRSRKIFLPVFVCNGSFSHIEKF